MIWRRIVHGTAIVAMAIGGIGSFLNCGSGEYCGFAASGGNENQNCRPEQERIADEYIAFRVEWQPDCSDFTNSGGSLNFSWNELNGGFMDGNPHNPWGYIDPMLVNGLDALRQSYGGPVPVSSGYRCPHGNVSVGSRYPATSRHVLGLAADIRTGDGGSEYDALRVAALDAGAEYISRSSDYRAHIIHVHWSRE